MITHRTSWRVLWFAPVILYACLNSLVAADTGTVVDVRTFGAKGDGTSDDTAAIARASQIVALRQGTLRFSAGTYIFDPTRAKITVGSNMTISGPGTIRVKANVGNYYYIIGADNPVFPLNKVTIEGLVVDQNIEENTRSTITVKNPETAQIVFLSYNVRNLSVHNCTFQASGINTVVANGPHVELATFENNRVIFHQRPGQPNFDNSAFYFTGRQGIARGNHCQAQPGLGATTCIEMHDGDITVTDNVIENYLLAMHIVNATSATVSNNIGTNIELGIAIWALPGRVCRNVKIINNKLSINNVDRGADEAAGIWTYYSQNVTGTVDGLTISNNTITFQPEKSPRAVKLPRINFGISTQARGEVRNVTISGNTIVNAPLIGIKLGDSDTRQSNISVENNVIRDAGANSHPALASYRSAIAGEGQLTQVNIGNNTIVQDGAQPGAYSVHLSKGSGSFQDVKVHRQRVVSKTPDALHESIPNEVRRTDD